LKTDTETKNLYVGEENRQQFQNNAVIMFSLIEMLNISVLHLMMDWSRILYGTRVNGRIINGVGCARFAKSERNSAS